MHLDTSPSSPNNLLVSDIPSPDLVQPTHVECTSKGGVPGKVKLIEVLGVVVAFQRQSL